MIRRPCLLSGGRGPSIEPILNELRFWTWGPVLAALLLARGGATTVLLRAVQLRALPHGLAWAFGFHREENGEGEITHGRALGIALAGTGAMGGVFGVAAAVAAGGPGALFWIWIGGLLAMAT
ncbi:MAG: alanine:cation symporter family protein, partial [Gemmatimonadota bacterium]